MNKEIQITNLIELLQVNDSNTIIREMKLKNDNILKSNRSSFLFYFFIKFTKN